MNNFPANVAVELERARNKYPRINSLHEGYAVILEELDEFKHEVWKKQPERSDPQMYWELVQLAAMCQRVAEDVLLR